MLSQYIIARKLKVKAYMDIQDNHKEDLTIVNDNLSANNTANEENSIQPHNKWLIPLISTLIGIVATIFVAWYQLSIGEEQAYAAALEREKSVMQDIVKIVEDHVINNSSVDIPRLARLIDLRSREENLRNKISTLQIIQKSEFNILNSAYLEFDKKNEYKKVFDSIYSKMGFEGLEGYKGLHINIANELAQSIKRGDTKTAITTLNTLLDLFNREVPKKTIAEPITNLVSNFLDIKFFTLMAIITSSFFVFINFLLRLNRKRAQMRAIEEFEHIKKYNSEFRRFMKRDQ